MGGFVCVCELIATANRRRVAIKALLVLTGTFEKRVVALPHCCGRSGAVLLFQPPSEVAAARFGSCPPAPSPFAAGGEARLCMESSVWICGLSRALDITVDQPNRSGVKTISMEQPRCHP